MELPLIDMAKRIPEKYREDILDANLIYKAIAVAHDPHMKVLFIIWKNHIEPNNTSLDINCSFCLRNILEAYKALEPVFVELSKAKKLLDL